MAGFFRKNKGILFLCLFFLLIYALSAFTRFRIMWWDEAVYVGMGKFLFSLGSSGLWEIFRPVFIPFLFGFFWKMGVDTFIIAKLVGISFAVGVVFLTYLLSTKFFDKKTSILAGLFMGLTPVFFKYSEYLLTDIPSLFFVLLASYFAVERKYFVSGISLGFAFLTKFPQLLIILPISLFIYLVSNKKVKNLSFFIMGVVLVGIIFVIFNLIFYYGHLSFFNSIFQPLIDAGLFQNNPLQNIAATGLYEKLYALFYYPINLFFIGAGSLFYLFIIFSFIDHKKNKDIILLWLILGFYFVYFTLIPYKQDRFLIFLLPFAAILASSGFFNFKGMLKKNFQSLAYILLISFFLILVWQDFRIYNEKDDVINKDLVGVYSYYKFNNVSGTILTTHPIFTVYSDNLYIPIYNTIKPDDTYVNEWEKNISAEGAVYSDTAFPCNNHECLLMRENLFNGLNDTYQLVYVFNQTPPMYLFYGQKTDLN